MAPGWVATDEAAATARALPRSRQYLHGDGDGEIDPSAKMDVFRGVGINGRPGAGARVSDSDDSDDESVVS